MEKNRENQKKFRSRFFSFEKEKPRQPTAFQKVRRGLVYLSGDSRPSPARNNHRPSQIYDTETALNMACGCFALEI